MWQSLAATRLSCRASHRKEQGDKGWGKRSFRDRGVRNTSAPTSERSNIWVLFTGKRWGCPTTPEHMANQAPQQPALPPRVLNFEDLKFRGSS